MKTQLLYTVAALALLSFPKVNFAQASGGNPKPSFALLTMDERIRTSGISQFADAGSCTRADADIIAPAKTGHTPPTLVQTDRCSMGGQCYSVFVDNQNFPANGLKTVSATVTEAPSGDGSGSAKSVVSIMMSGKGSSVSGEDISDETIKLELVLLEPIEPEPAVCNITLQHLSTTYAINKAAGNNVEITDFIWSMDRKSFTLSLNFNCTMRSTAPALDGVKELNLKGKLMRLHVTEQGAVSASE